MTEPTPSALLSQEERRELLKQRYATRWLQILADETSAAGQSGVATGLTTAGSESEESTPTGVKSGSPKKRGGGASAEPDSAGSPSAGVDRRTGGGLILFAGLFWLAAMLWTAHAQLADTTADPAIVASSVALILPTIIGATLFSGGCCGLAAVILAPRLSTSLAGRGWRRALVGATAGLLAGLVAGGAIVLTAGTTSIIFALAGTVAVAGLLGGAAAALPTDLLAAGLYGTLGVFGLGVLASPYQSRLKTLLGAGSDPASQVSAANTLSIVTAVLGGLIAGIIVYIFLRRRAEPPRWPAYMGAGAVAGLLLILTEVLTMIGGARLFALVGQISAVDRVSLAYVDSTRIEQALTVMFLGAITATIAIGRTLKRPDAE